MRTSHGAPARKGATATVGLAILAVAVTACGQSSIPGTTSTGTPATTSSPTATGSVVAVSETEYKIELPRTSFPAGRYTFVVTNQGKEPHALRVEGQGVKTETPTIEPGGSAVLAVTLQPGEYVLDCPVDDHAKLGMQQDITVS